MRILVVEDDPELSRRLPERLQRAGFAADCARTADEARDWPDIGCFAAIILDLGLPDGDGLDLLRHWRGKGEKVPILILTARGDWQEKVEGLNMGADDFVVKPVRFEELIARLHAIWRRRDDRPASHIQSGDLDLDPVSKAFSMAGVPVELSSKEFTLMQLFISRPGQLYSQAQLVEHLYSLDTERDYNAIEAHISRLRRKIGKERIKTVRGLGYRFDL